MNAMKSASIPFFEGTSKEIKKQQIRELEQEVSALATHRTEAKALAKESMPREARILIFDFTKGRSFLDRPGSDKLDASFLSAVQEWEYGGASSMSRASSLVSLLGMNPNAQNDPRVVVWDVFNEPSRTILYPIDAWITTGGSPMVTELLPGMETEHTEGLSRAARIMSALCDRGIPGIAICLGHQLLFHTLGGEIKEVSPVREFGTALVEKSPDYPDINFRMLEGVWKNETAFKIGAHHRQSVAKLPLSGAVRLLGFNAYSPYQLFAHPLQKKSLRSAEENDELVISIQNHPGMTAFYVKAVSMLKADELVKEGFCLEDMVFSSAPRARRMFLNFIKLVGRRVQKRLNEYSRVTQTRQ
jgi:GMP synthase-like glutamine amidotransferase